VALAATETTTPSDPFAAMSDGARSTLGGVFAFLLVAVGSANVGMFVALSHSGAWYEPACGAPFWMLCSLRSPLGFPLLPVYGAVFYGLVWREWDRLLGFVVLAAAASVAMPGALHRHPFADPSLSARFVVVAGTLAVLLGTRALRRRPRGGRPGARRHGRRNRS